MIHLHRRHRRSILEAAFEGGVAVPRSPRLLIVAGLLGFMFFWLTDPRFGAAALAAQENAQEIVNQSSMGSMVGMAGSAVVMIVGIGLSLWRTT
jgi:hypothetical protein